MGDADTVDELRCTQTLIFTIVLIMYHGAVVTNYQSTGAFSWDFVFGALAES